jgi:hypothetical protein
MGEKREEKKGKGLFVVQPEKNATSGTGEPSLARSADQKPWRRERSKHRNRGPLGSAGMSRAGTRLWG